MCFNNSRIVVTIGRFERSLRVLNLNMADKREKKKIGMNINHSRKVKVLGDSGALVYHITVVVAVFLFLRHSSSSSSSSYHY